MFMNKANHIGIFADGERARIIGWSQRDRESIRRQVLSARDQHPGALVTAILAEDWDAFAGMHNKQNGFEP